MSIEYSAVITRGYRPNAADMKSLTHDQIQELYDTEFLKDYNFNSADWEHNENWYGILGITMDYCDEDSYPAEINPSHYTDEDLFIKDLLLRYFPNKKDAEIHTYLGVKIS